MGGQNILPKIYVLPKAQGHEKQRNTAENCVYLHNQIGVGVVVMEGGEMR